MKQTCCLLLLLCLGGAVGCRTTPPSPSSPTSSSDTPAQEPKSPIVVEVEAAGSGDISKATNVSIQPWFGRQTVAFKQHVNGECAVASKSANAVWATTDEGKVCGAVQSVCFLGGCQVMPGIKPIGRMNSK